MIRKLDTNNSSFNYRDHLIDVYYSLQYFADVLYAHGMTIGLKDELADLVTVFKDGDEIPGDLCYLRALKSLVVKSFVEIIELLFKVQSSIINVNAISEKELGLDEEGDLEELEEPPHLDKSPYQQAEISVYEGVRDVFILTWQLANQTTEVRPEIGDQFDDWFNEDDLQIASEDANVQLLLMGLNEVLRINRLIDYGEA